MKRQNVVSDTLGKVFKHKAIPIVLPMTEHAAKCGTYKSITMFFEWQPRPGEVLDAWHTTADRRKGLAPAKTYKPVDVEDFPYYFNDKLHFRATSLRSPLI